MSVKKIREALEDESYGKDEDQLGLIFSKDNRYYKDVHCFHEVEYNGEPVIHFTHPIQQGGPIP